jgi:hypothetical protein
MFTSRPRYLPRPRDRSRGPPKIHDSGTFGGRRRFLEPLDPATETGRVSRSPALAVTRSIAVMNSALTVIDPAAPRCRNPIAIGPNPDELRCSCGTHHTYWKRSRIASVFVALGKTGRGYHDPSHPRYRGRNNGEKRVGHTSSPNVNAASCSNYLRLWLGLCGLPPIVRPLSAQRVADGPIVTDNLGHGQWSPLSTCFTGSLAPQASPGAVMWVTARQSVTALAAGAPLWNSARHQGLRLAFRHVYGALGSTQRTAAASVGLMLSP